MLKARVLILLSTIVLIRIDNANTTSTLFKAPNTSLPIPKPNGIVIPGAWNFNQASIKLIAHTNPIQRKVILIRNGLIASFFVIDFMLQ